MKIDIRLSDSDRERYGGPEWLTLDESAINDMPAGQLEEWERELLAGGISIIEAFMEWHEHLSVRACRAVFWIAMRQAGVHHPYVDFDPQVLRAATRSLSLPPQAGDVDPPDDGSSSPQEPSPVG